MKDMRSKIYVLIKVEPIWLLQVPMCVSISASNGKRLRPSMITLLWPWVSVSVTMRSRLRQLVWIVRLKFMELSDLAYSWDGFYKKIFVLLFLPQGANRLKL